LLTVATAVVVLPTARLPNTNVSALWQIWTGRTGFGRGRNHDHSERRRRRGAAQMHEKGGEHAPDFTEDAKRIRRGDDVKSGARSGRLPVLEFTQVLVRGPAAATLRIGGSPSYKARRRGAYNPVIVIQRAQRFAHERRFARTT
jgi:hypothetical protein